MIADQTMSYFMI